MKILLILNDPPYGTERSFNALRLARALVAKEGTELRVFLIGDAVGCAVSGQKTPDGYYNLDKMILSLARKGATVGCCGTCIEARGITEEMLTEGARRSSMDELTEWTLSAEKVLVF
ncbi:MAG: DsrE family protein [Actinobacteria bacterium]|nr:DsrE family protein [Actinomycetota bacterium]